jgi:hypothetical protein
MIDDVSGCPRTQRKNQEKCREIHDEGSKAEAVNKRFGSSFLRILSTNGFLNVLGVQLILGQIMGPSNCGFYYT